MIKAALLCICPPAVMIGAVVSSPVARSHAKAAVHHAIKRTPAKPKPAEPAPCSPAVEIITVPGSFALPPVALPQMQTPSFAAPPPFRPRGPIGDIAPPWGVSNVPEPQTWALMLVGFAVVGSVGRRNRTVA
jgi:hypothetical protein